MENEFLQSQQEKFGQIRIIQSRTMIFKVWLISCMPPSQVALCYNMWCHNSIQLSNETIHRFHKMLLFMKIHLPSTFTLWYVRDTMIVHAFMIELDQPDYWYPRKKFDPNSGPPPPNNKKKKKKKKTMNICEQSQWTFYFIFLFNGITYSGRVPSREGDIQIFAWLVLWNELSKFAQNITVGFVKLLSTRPIHIVAWETSPLIDYVNLKSGHHVENLF